MNTLVDFLPGLEDPNIIIAIKNGDLTYEGKLCRNGHTTRYTKNDECAECKKNYYYKNRERILKYKQRYFLENIEKMAERDSKYYQINKSKVNETQKKYMKNRYHSDELYRAKVLLRSQLRTFYKNRNRNKKGRTHELLGYSAKEFCEHIESLFKDGMTWDNQGNNGGWEIDHRIPQSYFTSIDQLKECFALENLKPEWGEWNLKKGNRFIG